MGIEMLSSFGEIVWEDRYALKGENGKIIEKDILETFRRVATAIASKEDDSENWGNKFYDIMVNQYFCPAGRVIAHAGTHYSQLLNCFVLPFQNDSLEEIMNTSKYMAIVQKFGGGCIGGESNVLTNKGSISIKEIVEGGDKDLRVLSYNPETKKTEYCDILDRHTNHMPGERIYAVKFFRSCDNVRATIRASDWHPFFVANSDFYPFDVTEDGKNIFQIRADRLKTGMAVIGCQSGITEGESVQEYNLVSSSKPTFVSETLYDLTIDKNQTYLASDPNTDTYVVVHNTGFNFSKLRPSGSYIKGVNGRSSGTTGFISMMSTISEVIEQGGCFTGDTLVATVEGPKKIRELKRGDYVYSYSKNGDGFVIRSCASDAFLTKKSAEIWMVKTNKNLIVFCTPDHPFMPEKDFDFNKMNYVRAKDLNKNIGLRSFDGKVVKEILKGNGYVFSREKIFAEVSEYSCFQDVYNVEIMDTHNFVICNEDMSTGVVVSNTRRGASIGLLEVWHPDIWEFISYKTEHNWGCLREFMDINDTDKWESFKYENLYKWQMFNVSVGITDEFLEAVKYNKEWRLYWGDEEWELYTVFFKKSIRVDNYKEIKFEVMANCGQTAIWKVKKKIPYPTSSDIFEVVSKRRIKAPELWDRICYNAWADGCPGIINLTTARKMHNLEYVSPIEATNPCLHGDILVAVADGRNAVSIKQLAEEDKDVPVYCRDDNGKVVIRMMRHPRISGYNQKIYKITLDDGSVIKATGNHELLLSNGCYVTVTNLKCGDSLNIMTKECSSFHKKIERGKDHSETLKVYYWIEDIPEHRMIYKFHRGEIKKGYVVHHKDHDTLNNCIKNLESMSVGVHNALHAVDMIGDRNSMRRAQIEWSEEKWQQYRDNMSVATSGERNGRYSGISNSKLFDIAVNLTKEYERKVSSPEWQRFALKNNYPSQFSKYRTEVFGTVASFLDKAAIEASAPGTGFKHKSLTDYKRFIRLKEESDLDLFFDGGTKVRKICEACGKEFIVTYGRREQGYCNIKCRSNNYVITEEGKEKIREVKVEIRKDKRVLQINVFNDLKLQLGRDPMKKEWASVCKSKAIPFRLPTKREIAEKGHIGTFCGYGELKKSASLYNHRVVKIEEDGYETVYNGTVDDFHNFYFGAFKGTVCEKDTSFTNGRNCGEQLLGKYSSCNLSSILLPNFVEEETLSIDWAKLGEVVSVAVRFSDDVLDNCKFSLPEIEEKALQERRIGVGTMGVHDMLIKMELDYDSDVGRDAVEEVLVFIRDEAYRASIKIAEEKGSFPVYKKKKFLKSGFIQTLPKEIIKLIDKKGIRNGSLLSQAPTGCLVKNTLIPTTEGLLKIGEISDIKEKECIYLKDKRFCVRNDMSETKVTHFFNNGKTETIKVITTKGYSIEGTPDHKIRVISKGLGYSWKRLKEIEISDKIVLKKNFFIDKTTWLKPNVAKILGYYMAKGWWSSSSVKKGSNILGYKIYFSLDPANIQLQKEIKKLILDAWGATFKITENRIRVRDADGFKFEISNVKLYRWFEQFSCIKYGAINAFIPDIILKSSKECLIEFIKGYWMGDDCFQMKKENISFKTISVKMATEFQVALLSIGIPSSVYYDDSAVDKEVFIEGRKIKSIKYSYAISVDRGYTKEILDYFKIEAPFDFVEKTDEVVPVFINELSKYNLPVNSEIDQDDTFVSIRAYKKSVSKEKWNWFVANDLMIVFAKEIIKSKKDRDTFDLTVAERSHTYIANGFVTHNSISALHNISSGCEPLFALSFQRNTRLGSYEDGCASYLKWQEENPNSLKPSYFKTAPEISPEDHVKMLILFSKYIDSAVSKTVNLPSQATVQVIKDTFIYAMENGVKGMTVFRDGSKEGVLVNKEEKKGSNIKTWENMGKAKQVIEKVKSRKEIKIEKVDEIIPIMEEEDCIEGVMAPKKRGDKTMGSTYRVHMHNHNLYITVNRNKDGELVEIFATVGESKKPNAHHTSGVEDSWAEGLGKMVSLALRAGVKPASIIRNLKNIPSDKPVFATIGDSESSEHVPSPPHAIARVIEKELLGDKKNNNGNHCKECGSTNLRMKSPTCCECIDCGFSSCG